MGANYPSFRDIELSRIQTEIEQRLAEAVKAKNFEKRQILLRECSYLYSKRNALCLAGVLGTTKGPSMRKSPEELEEAVKIKKGN